MQLYDIFEEPLAEEIRGDQEIQGIPLPGTELRAVTSLYANDNTFFILTLISLYKLFHHFDNFERATGARVKPSKTQGLCLGGARPLLEQKIPIEWRDDDGLLILGIYFFIDQLRTTNFNWGMIKIKLNQFISRTKNRKLSLKGKIINLNMVALSKLWYLSTVFPIPNWELASTERLIFRYLWEIPDDEVGNEPIARKTIYLPKDRGGLGLLHPVCQSRALRFKFFGKIVNPECTSKWVFLARYWLGNPLGRLAPEWAFLRGNHLPRPDRPRYPEYYVDCLRLLENTPDLIKMAWTAPVIRAVILKQDPIIPRAQAVWPRMGVPDPNWKKSMVRDLLIPCDRKPAGHTLSFHACGTVH